jgi:hypothetical protein
MVLDFVREGNSGCVPLPPSLLPVLLPVRTHELRIAILVCRCRLYRPQQSRVSSFLVCTLFYRGVIRTCTTGFSLSYSTAKHGSRLPRMSLVVCTVCTIIEYHCPFQKTVARCVLRLSSRVLWFVSVFFKVIPGICNQYVTTLISLSQCFTSLRYLPHTILQRSHGQKVKEASEATSKSETPFSNSNCYDYGNIFK